MIDIGSDDYLTNNNIILVKQLYRMATLVIHLVSRYIGTFILAHSK